MDDTFISIYGLFQILCLEVSKYLLFHKSCGLGRQSHFALC